MQQRYCNRREAAEYLGVHPDTVRKWTLHKGLPVIRTSKKSTRYKISDLDEFMDKMSVVIETEREKIAATVDEIMKSLKK